MQPVKFARDGIAQSSSPNMLYLFVCLMKPEIKNEEFIINDYLISYIL